MNLTPQNGPVDCLVNASSQARRWAFVFEVIVPPSDVFRSPSRRRTRVSTGTTDATRTSLPHVGEIWMDGWSSSRRPFGASSRQSSTSWHASPDVPVEGWSY